MNIEKEIKKKEKELELVKNTLVENLIISQQKHSDYLEEQEKLEQEINRLKENITKPKITKTWIELENGWKKRIYKHE